MSDDESICEADGLGTSIYGYTIIHFGTWYFGADKDFMGFIVVSGICLSGTVVGAYSCSANAIYGWACSKARSSSDNRLKVEG